MLFGSRRRATPRISKAVIPVAGMGTRFLPATKALPKEMLPLVDKPVIQYVVEEAVSAGLTDILLVTGRNKNALENHFDRAHEIEFALQRKGDKKRLNDIAASNQLADIHYTRQGDPRGLGHAVLRAKSHVGDDSFAVLLGDDVIDWRDELLGEMLALHARENVNVVALMEVPPESIHLYGCAAIRGKPRDGIVRISDLVEKPEPDEAPSNYAVIGRYLLRPEIFEILEDLEPGRGGEIQLTDALEIAAKNPRRAGAVKGVIFSGRRYDTGDKLDYLKATVRIAVERDDLGSEFRGWLKDFVGDIK